MTVEYSWSTKRDACEIPDRIYEDYLPVIRQGVLTALYSIQGTEYVSAQQADIAQRKYTELLTKVKARLVHNFSRSRPRMHRRPSFWR